MGKTFDDANARNNRRNEDELSRRRIKEERARERRAWQVDDYDALHEAAHDPRRLIFSPANALRHTEAVEEAESWPRVLGSIARSAPGAIQGALGEVPHAISDAANSVADTTRAAARQTMAGLGMARSGAAFAGTAVTALPGVVTDMTAFFASATSDASRRFAGGVAEIVGGGLTTAARAVRVAPAAVNGMLGAAAEELGNSVGSAVSLASSARDHLAAGWELARGGAMLAGDAAKLAPAMSADLLKATPGAIGKVIASAASGIGGGFATAARAVPAVFIEEIKAMPDALNEIPGPETMVLALAQEAASMRSAIRRLVAPRTKVRRNATGRTRRKTRSTANGGRRTRASSLFERNPFRARVDAGHRLKAFKKGRLRPGASPMHLDSPATMVVGALHAMSAWGFGAKAAVDANKREDTPASRVARAYAQGASRAMDRIVGGAYRSEQDVKAAHRRNQMPSDPGSVSTQALHSQASSIAASVQQFMDRIAGDVTAIPFPILGAAAAREEIVEVKEHGFVYAPMADAGETPDSDRGNEASSPPRGSESAASPGTYLLDKADSRLVVDSYGEYIVVLPALAAAEGDRRGIDLDRSQLLFKMQEQGWKDEWLVLEGFPDRHATTPSLYMQIAGEGASIQRMKELLEASLPRKEFIWGGEGKRALVLSRPFDSCEILDLQPGDEIRVVLPDLNGRIDRRIVKKARALKLSKPHLGTCSSSDEIYREFRLGSGANAHSLRIEGEESAVQREFGRVYQNTLKRPLHVVIDETTSEDDRIQKLEGPDDECLINGIPDGEIAIVRLPKLDGAADRRKLGLGGGLRFQSCSGVRAETSGNSECMFTSLDEKGHLARQLRIVGNTAAVQAACAGILAQNVPSSTPATADPGDTLEHTLSQPIPGLDGRTYVDELAGRYRELAIQDETLAAEDAVRQILEGAAQETGESFVVAVIRLMDTSLPQSGRRIARAIQGRLRDPAFLLNPYDATASNYALLDALAKNPHLRVGKTSADPAWGIIKSADGTYEAVVSALCRELKRGEMLTILEQPPANVEIHLGPHSVSLDFMPRLIAGAEASPIDVDAADAIQFVDGKWTATFALEEAGAGRKTFTCKGKYKSTIVKAATDWNDQIAKYAKDKAVLLRADETLYEHALRRLPDIPGHEHSATLASHGVGPLGGQTRIEELQVNRLFGPLPHLRFLAYYKKLHADVLAIYSETPSLVAIADDYMREKIKAEFGLDVNPRETFLCKFEPRKRVNVPMHKGPGPIPGAAPIVPDWSGIRSDLPERDGGYRYAEKTASWCISLTELAIRNFDAVDVMKQWGKDGIDERLGLYAQSDTAKAFGMESRLHSPSGELARASTLQRAMQRDDFFKVVQERMAAFWSKNRDRYAQAQWDVFFLKLVDQGVGSSGNFGLSQDGYRMLLGVLERSKSDASFLDGVNEKDTPALHVAIQRFSIGTHMASDILLFESPSDGRLILYIPQGGQSFFEFKDAEQLRTWVILQSKDPALKKNLLGHFSDADRQSNDALDATLVGVEAMLDTYCALQRKGMRSGRECGRNIFQLGLPGQGLPSEKFADPAWAVNRKQMDRKVVGSPFLQMALWAEERMKADAAYQVRSAAELQEDLASLKREAWLNAVLPVLLLVPGAIGKVGLAAFGILTSRQLYQAIRMAVTGRTQEERDQGWQAIASGLANIVFMGFPLATRAAGVHSLWKRIGRNTGTHPEIGARLDGLIESQLERRVGPLHEFPASPVDGYALPDFTLPENLKATANADPEVQEALNNFHNWKHVREKVVAKEGEVPERGKVDEILLMAKNTQKIIDARSKKLQPGLQPAELEIDPSFIKGTDVDESIQENVRDRAREMSDVLGSYNKKNGISAERMRALKEEWEWRLHDHFDRILNSPRDFAEVSEQLREYLVTDIEFPPDLKPDARGLHYFQDQWYADIAANKVRTGGVDSANGLIVLDKNGEVVPADRLPLVTRNFHGKWRPRQSVEAKSSPDDQVSFQGIEVRNSKYHISMYGVDHEVQFHIGACRWIDVKDTHAETQADGSLVPSRTHRTGFRFDSEKESWEEVDVDLSIQASTASQAQALMALGHVNGLPLLPQPGPVASALGGSALDMQYYREWRGILQDRHLTIPDDMKAKVLPVLERFAAAAYERQIDIPLTEAERQDLQTLLDERSGQKGAVTNYLTVDALNQKNFEVPLTLYRAHVGENVEVSGLQRSPGATTDPDRYLADIIMHTARSGGSAGSVLSLSARQSKAAGFQREHPNSTVRKIFTESEYKNFRTATDIISKDGPRLVREGKIKKATLFKAMDQLDHDEWEVFYVKGDVPPSLLKLPSGFPEKSIDTIDHHR